MKLYIPEIGDRLKLSKDWKFKLHHEYRNKTLFAAVGVDMNVNWRNTVEPIDVTLDKGIILIVDRIYIRKGAADYSSLSFRIEDGNERSTINRKRFWAKLDDVNNIEFSEAERPINPHVNWNGKFNQYLKKGTTSSWNLSDRLSRTLLPSPIIHSYTVNHGDVERFELIQTVKYRSLTDDEAKKFANARGYRAQLLRDAPYIRVKREYQYIEDISISLKDIKSGEILGTWGTEATARKHAKRIATEETV